MESEESLTSRRARRARSDFIIFCLAVLLAAGTVVGATAARRAPLTTVSIAGYVNLFSDPGVVQELRAHGYNIVTNNLGAGQIENTPLNGYQLAYVPNQLAAGTIQDELNGKNAANDAVFFVRSRLVVVTYRSIARLLENAGIASVDKYGDVLFNLKAYVAAVDNYLHWNQIQGNTGKDAPFPNPGQVVLNTSDPRSSVLTRMFVAVASYALNHYSLVTPQTKPTTVNSIISQLQLCFSQQGSISRGGNPDLNTFLEGDINDDPMALTYESEFVWLKLTHDPRITSDMVMMYVSPEANVEDTLIPLDNTGSTVANLFQQDQKIQRIAEKTYGFITTSQDVYHSDMRAEGVTVAGLLTTESVYPVDSVLNEIITGIYRPLPASQDNRWVAAVRPPRRVHLSSLPFAA